MPKRRRKTKSGLLYRLMHAHLGALLEEHLEIHEGNRTYTAAALGIERTYLLRLLREHGLQDYRFGGRP